MDGESTLGLRAMTVALVALVVGLGWHVLRPHSTFAADGLDADCDVAVRESRERNRLGVVLYTADWYQALRAGALADPAVWRELQHRAFATVDLTRPTAANQAHCRVAGVSGIPTFVRYDRCDRDGHEPGRTHGMAAADLVDWLRKDD